MTPVSIRFALLALVLSLTSLAQTPTAGIVCRVLDPKDSIVPGAGIEVRNLETYELRRGSRSPGTDSASSRRPTSCWNSNRSHGSNSNWSLAPSRRPSKSQPRRR